MFSLPYWPHSARSACGLFAHSMSSTFLISINPRAASLSRPSETSRLMWWSSFQSKMFSELSGELSMPMPVPTLCTKAWSLNSTYVYRSTASWIRRYAARSMQIHSESVLYGVGCLHLMKRAFLLLRCTCTHLNPNVVITSSYFQAFACMIEMVLFCSGFWNCGMVSKKHFMSAFHRHVVGSAWMFSSISAVSCIWNTYLIRGAVQCAGHMPDIHRFSAFCRHLS